MWRWPPTSFWLIKSIFFVLFLPLLCMGAVVVFVNEGMRGTAPPGPVSGIERRVAWLVTTPIQPGEQFPTDHALLDLVIPVGANAVLWSWIGSLICAMGVHLIVRLIRWGGRGGTAGKPAR